MNFTPTVIQNGPKPWDWRAHIRYRNAKGQIRTKIMCNRPVACDSDEECHFLDEAKAKQKILNSITWGWKKIPGWDGFRVKLIDHPEDVIDFRIMRRHEDPTARSKEAQLEYTIKQAMKALPPV